MTIALYLVLGYIYATTSPFARTAWEAPAFDPSIMTASLLIVAELAVLTAVSLFFSTFSSSALMSVVFTVGIYVMGLASAELRGFNDIVDAPVVGSIVAAIGWLTPAFSEFDVKNEIVHGHPVPMVLVGSMVTYAAIYASALVAAAVTVFSRREFK